jgi:hypothetical protein
MKRTTFLAALLMVVCVSSAQRIKLLTGNFQSLKPIAEFNVVFDYDGLKVDRVSEAEFLADRMKKREAKGIDQKFRNSWFADRENRYEPKFIESFNKRFGSKANVRVAKNLPEAKYTMSIKTLWIHPGFNVGVMHNSSLIRTLVTVFETADPRNTLLSAEYDRVSGKGIFTPIGFMDYNSGYRISEAYAKLGKSIAAQIKRKYKK